MLELAYKALDFLVSAFVGLRRVQVRVHFAAWLSTNELSVFVNVTNTSRDRDVEITHIWFETQPPIHLANAERPLPKRLQHDESWETWAPLLSFPPEHWSALPRLARVRISTGEVFHGKENKNVPALGTVAGGTTSR
jgi:hypothetical protein